MVSVMKTMVDSSKLQATKAIARRVFRWSTLCLFARVSPFINLASSLYDQWLSAGFRKVSRPV